MLLNSVLKGFAGNKVHVIQKLKFVLGRVENIVGKGEILVTRKASSPGSLKVGIVLERVDVRLCIKCSLLEIYLFFINRDTRSYNFKKTFNSASKELQPGPVAQPVALRT